MEMNFQFKFKMMKHLPHFNRGTGNDLSRVHHKNSFVARPSFCINHAKITGEAICKDFTIPPDVVAFKRLSGVL